MTSLAKISAPVARALGLAWLLHPLPTAEFFARHWGRSHLLLSRGKTPHQLFRRARVDSFLAPALSTALLALAAQFVTPQMPPAPEAQLESITAEIGAGGLKSEMGAFDRLVSFRARYQASHPELKAQINLGFVRVLAWVNADANRRASRPIRPRPKQAPAAISARQETGSVEGAFLGNAIAAVAALHDVREIPVLLDDLETGNMATQALAAFGNQTIAPLLARLHARSTGSVVCGVNIPEFCLEEMHDGALRALTQMASPTILGQLRPDGRATVRDLIRNSIASASTQSQIAGLQGAGLLGDRSLEPMILRFARATPKEGMRMQAVIALGDLRDPSLRPVFAKIAASDHDSNVRQAARDALKKLGGAQ